MSSGKYFDERFSTTVKPKRKIIPFFHTTEAIYLRDILETGSLSATGCSIFKEKLLYLSYGKPAYRSNNSGINSNLKFFLPVSFIINPLCITNIKRIFPFDSGGFSLYGDFMHPKMTLSNFDVNPNIDSLQKIVDFFFGNDREYFYGNARRNIKYDIANSEVESYHNLILNNAKQRQDDRKSSIEVQLGDSVKISDKTVLAIIMPEEYAASDLIQQLLGYLNVDAFEYKTRHGLAGGDYYFHMLEIARQYLNGIRAF